MQHLTCETKVDEKVEVRGVSDDKRVMFSQTGDRTKRTLALIPKLQLFQE